MKRGDAAQPGRGHPLEDVEAAMAGSSQGGSGDRACWRPLEEESPLVESDVRQGGGLGVGPRRRTATENQQPAGVSPLRVKNLQRGEAQWMKKNAMEVLALANTIRDVANKEDRFVVRALRWSGTIVRDWAPWCSWMNLCAVDEVESKRAAHLPLWRFARKVWDKQDKAGRLVLTEQPWLSEALNLTFTQARPNCHRAQVDQCCFGLKDKVNGKPHRKRTALDVNDPNFANALRRGASCRHERGEYQIIEGKVWFQGVWQNRSQLAGVAGRPL